MEFGFLRCHRHKVAQNPVELRMIVGILAVDFFRSTIVNAKDRGLDTQKAAFEILDADH